MVKVNTQNYYK